MKRQTTPEESIREEEEKPTSHPEPSLMEKLGAPETSEMKRFFNTFDVIDKLVEQHGSMLKSGNLEKQATKLAKIYEDQIYMTRPDIKEARHKELRDKLHTQMAQKKHGIKRK